MYNWLVYLLSLLSGAFTVSPPPRDYTATLAVEAAYITLAYPAPPVTVAPDDTPTPPDGPTKTCPRCKGKKTVPSGGGEDNIRCPDCKGLGVVPATAVTAAPPAPGDCATGQCPLQPKSAPVKTTITRPYPSR